jgi:hypothetical protein
MARQRNRQITVPGTPRKRAAHRAASGPDHADKTDHDRSNTGDQLALCRLRAGTVRRDRRSLGMNEAYSNRAEYYRTKGRRDRSHRRRARA